MHYIHLPDNRMWFLRQAYSFGAFNPFTANIKILIEGPSVFAGISTFNHTIGRVPLVTTGNRLAPAVSASTITNNMTSHARVQRLPLQISRARLCCQRRFLSLFVLPQPHYHRRHGTWYTNCTILYITFFISIHTVLPRCFLQTSLISPRPKKGAPNNRDPLSYKRHPPENMDTPDCGWSFGIWNEETTSELNQRWFSASTKTIQFSVVRASIRYGWTRTFIAARHKTGSRFWCGGVLGDAFMNLATRSLPSGGAAQRVDVLGTSAFGLTWVRLGVRLGLRSGSQLCPALKQRAYLPNLIKRNHK